MTCPRERAASFRSCVIGSQKAKRLTMNVAMPAAPSAAPHVAPTLAARSDDLVPRLAKLAELRDTGVLTEEEFATVKVRLLS